jgi:hypothetical protein
MPPKRCPKCGATQQWVLWQRCFCGYDFGPPEFDHAETPNAPWQPLFVPQRFATAAILPLVAILIAIRYDVGFAWMVVLLGESVVPQDVELRPAKTQARDLLIVILIGVAAVVFVGQLTKYIPRNPVVEHWIGACLVSAVAIWNLTNLPRRWREVIAQSSRQA